MPFKASAPASLMLLGEYGVLYGKQALVCAIDKRIHVTLSPRIDDKIEIFSHPYSRSVYSTDIQHLTVQRPFQFVLGVLKQYQSKLTQGCTIKIESEFSDQVGFGSSAAVTVATLAALFAWLDIKVSKQRHVPIGRLIVQGIQGVGSGADIAASIYGGLIRYRASPLIVEKYPLLYPLTVLYSGFKTPTAVAVTQVQKCFTHRPDVLHQLCDNIAECVSEGIQLINEHACLSKLGNILLRQQELLVKLGVSLPLLQNMVDSLNAQPGIFGAKISGAGLGDCVIGLGYPPDNYVYCERDANVKKNRKIEVCSPAAILFPDASKIKGCVQRFPVSMTASGVQCETI